MYNGTIKGSSYQIDVSFGYESQLLVERLI